MRIVWSTQARADLHYIQTYLAERSPRGSERIWLRIVRRVAAQADTPLAAPLEGDGPLRRMVVTQTPYLVFYLVEGDELRVEAVMHAAQNR